MQQRNTKNTLSQNAAADIGEENSSFQGTASNVATMCAELGADKDSTPYLDGICMMTTRHKQPMPNPQRDVLCNNN